MSVLYDPVTAAGWLDAPDDWVCFYCGGALTWPCVVWHGNSLVLLHTVCAAHLGPGLIADAREAALAGDPAPHWRHRGLSIARHRMLTEEHAA